MELITSIKENCKLCYACVRVCPARAIKIEDDHAQVIHDRCIGCGHCVTVCSPDALRYVSSIDEVFNLLSSDKKVAAICAESIAAEFPDISSRRNFVGMLKDLGFDYVFETSFGADLVARKFHNLFTNFKGKYYISANCPSVFLHVEKYHPDSVKNLAPIVSPMVAMAKVVRHLHGNNIKIVYIGSCTASKLEACRTTDDGTVDQVLTFVELRKMFRQKHISENTVEYSYFDKPIGGKGCLYPISRGMVMSVGINEDALTGRLISTNGRYNFIEALREFDAMTNLKKHLDVFYCEGGCIMGAGMTANGKKFYRRSLVVEYTKKRLADFDQKEWEANMDFYIKNLDLSRKFEADDKRLPTPPKERVLSILQAMGKIHDSDHIGCGACGYETCYDFAEAVSQGLARTDMCISFAMQNKQNYIKSLKITNQQLENTRQELELSEQKAKVEKEVAKEIGLTAKFMLQNVPSGVVIVDKDLKILQSNKRFINLLGDDAENINEVIPELRGADLKTLLPVNIVNLFQYSLTNNDSIENKDIKLGEQLLNISIFPIKQNEIVGAVIRDMYLPEVRREEVMARITEVIDKNLKMVQNIGFLLGEGASETEQMLKSIINTYKSDNKK